MTLVASRLDRAPPTAAAGLIRCLGEGDRAAFLNHQRRLDPESRRMRFGGVVGHAFLETYAARAIGADSLIKGLFVDGVLRGVAELRFLDAGRTEAEAAFSLEPAWQGQGYGARLFQSLLDGARNRGIKRLVLQCLRENAAMQTIARRHEAELSFHDGEVVAEIRHPHADAGTIAREHAEERAAHIVMAAERGVERIAREVGVDRRAGGAL